MRTQSVAMLGLVVICLASASPSKADTIFTNLGPGQSFNPNGGWVIGDCCSEGPGQVFAFPFIPTQTATFTDATLALQRISGPSPLNVEIQTSSGGMPDAILDTLTQTMDLSPIPSLVDFTCSTCGVLNAGTLYFLVAQQTNPLNVASWGFSNSQIDTAFFNENGSATGPWTPNTGPISAYELHGVAIAPEPPSALLLASGLIALLAVGYKRFV
ncbi:choice-of-anchor R domain-containing protein [Tunturiibacter gelidiferens]|jgi:hypothetical protein|uniref:choice-of-anchor R domain-containing protein n=1 Tax=Tunturiibacter gelidiferens TaxID=3069689 RepID=UPI003D9B0A36